MVSTVSFARLRISFALSLLCVLSSAIARADQWTAPTQEELSMTSQAGAPGAPAVYLFREEITVDHLHMYSEYVRLKILTDGGKDHANVEVKYVAGGDMGFSITDVAGRTIHPDGTVIPFTGKPYERMVVKAQGFKEKAKVFTLPDVTVGSIIEYRYKVRWEDNMYTSPHWIVQNDLYLRRGHFSWFPTDRELVTSDERGQMVSTLAWTPILPPGAEVKRTELPGSNLSHDGSSQIDLVVHDIAPSIEEEFMPPISSLGYRVLFYSSPYRNPEEFWKGEGKYWSKRRDKFIGPGKGVQAAVQELVSPSDTQEQKLKKLYAAVEGLENTDYTRERSRNEDKAEGLNAVHTTDDILARKRGSSDQLAQLFVAMARAAGMKAYLMLVTNRDRTIFLKNFLSFDQLDDDIAIVEVDGKERAFDPGSRYCPFGHLAWKHSESAGLRQTEGGSTLAGTPGESYQASGIIRVANLKMDETGVVTGKVDLKFTGAPALKWRQKALTDDKETVEREMKEHAEHMLPGGMDVKVLSIDKLDQYEEPLTVALSIKGPIGSSTGKRLLVTGDLFECNSKPTFSRDKREMAVYFPYPYNARDAIRINLPPGFEVESVPVNKDVKMGKTAAYDIKAVADGTGVTIRRNLLVGEIIYLPAEYPDLKAFYGQFEAKDQEPVILKVAGPVQATTGSGQATSVESITLPTTQSQTQKP
ncbi:DUF3857 domain-containing protein [Granulicella aggregans]|jgi:hypothetical protein|uniref:DUF3857 domain-containing protein n=1 Tax=Granulicella aggregans TaxID=474949 RepID=UPI0021E0CCCD|nr:DUF3857 domain-containing protein [Granulicella aggregans]